MRVAATLIALSLAVVPLAPVAQEVLSPDELRGQALAAVTQGEDARALRLSRAMLERDADDVTMLLVASRAARNLGLHDAASEFADRGWAAAQTDGERYRAALVTAQALSSRGAKLRAQFWLRRAAEIAPGEAERARAVADLRHVRARTPTSVKLRFSVAPTSNANGGATSDRVDLFGLPIVLSGSALALSGTRFVFGAEIGHVLASSDRTRTQVSLDLSHQTYRLSGEAERIAPDASGSDFAQTGVEIGVSHDISAGAGEGYWSLGGTIGTTWYGGDPLERSARLTLGRTWRSDGGILFEAEAGVEKSKRLQGGDALPLSMDLSLDAARRVPGGTLRLGLFASESRSDAMTYDFTSGAVSAGYSLGAPVLERLGGGLELSLSASVGVTEFDATPYKGGGRQDRIVQGALTAAFPGLDYYGFAPSVTLEGSRRASDVDLFDTQTLGISLGIVSTF